MKLTFSLDHLPDNAHLPVRCESLHCDAVGAGWRVENAPFFVQDLAFGDLIEVTAKREDGEVLSWRHLSRSGHSNVWLIETQEAGAKSLVAALRGAGCLVEGMPQLNLYSVDVPPTVSASTIDDLLSGARQAGVEVAYPAWRHPDE